MSTFSAESGLMSKVSVEPLSTTSGLPETSTSDPSDLSVTVSESSLANSPAGRVISMVSVPPSALTSSISNAMSCCTVSPELTVLGSRDALFPVYVAAAAVPVNATVPAKTDITISAARIRLRTLSFVLVMFGFVSVRGDNTFLAF